MGNIFIIIKYNIFNFFFFNPFAKNKTIVEKKIMENTIIEKPIFENTDIENSILENTVYENPILEKIIKKKEEYFFDKNFYSFLQERGNDVFTVHKINENVVLVKFTADYNNFCVIYKMYNNKNMVNYYTYAKFKLIRKYNKLYREHAYNSISIGDLLDDVKTVYEYIDYYKIYDN